MSMHYIGGGLLGSLGFISTNLNRMKEHGISLFWVGRLAQWIIISLYLPLTILQH